MTSQTGASPVGPSGATVASPSTFSAGKRFWVHALLISALVALILDLGWLNLTSKRTFAPNAVLPNDSRLAELRALAANDPHDPDLHLTLAQVYLKYQHFFSARAEFDLALKLHADEGDVLRGRVTTNMALLRTDLVRADLERLIGLQPRHLETYLTLAETCLQDGDTAVARRTLERIPLIKERSKEGLPECDVEPFTAADMVATAYSHLDDWKTASRIVDRCLALQPNRLASQVEKGRILYALGRKAEAIPLLQVGLKAAPKNSDLFTLLGNALTVRNAPGDIDRAFACYQNACLCDGHNGAAVLAFARECDRRHYRAAAAFAYQRAVELGMEGMLPLLRSGDLMLELGNREEGWYRRGRFFELTHDTDRALIEYRKLTTLHSCCRSGFLHLARVYSSRGEAKATIACLKRAMELDPARSKELRWLLALSYGANHQTQKQVDLYDEIVADGTALLSAQGQQTSVSDDPGVNKSQTLRKKTLEESAEACYQIEALVKADGKRADSERWLVRAMQLDSRNSDYPTEMGILFLDRRSDPGELKKAIDYLQTGVRLDPSNYRAVYNLGLVLTYSGDLDGAILALRHAVDLQPENGTGYHSLSLALKAAGKRDEAQDAEAIFQRYQKFSHVREVLEARVKRDGANAEAHRQLAEFNLHAGETLAAISSFEKSLALKPNQPPVRRALADALGSLGRREEQRQQLAILEGTPSYQNGELLKAVEQAEIGNSPVRKR